MVFPARNFRKRKEKRGWRKGTFRVRSGQRLRKCAIMIVAWIAIYMMAAAPIHAMLPYETEYFEYTDNYWVGVQPVYMPNRVITGESEFGPAFSKPNDLYIDGNGRVFVADTGNHRIVVLNHEGNVTAVIGTEEGEGKLNAPEGVFVDSSGVVYVADTGNRRIAVFDARGRYIREYGRPESTMLPDPDQYYFVPSKLVVDNRGVMYIVVKGSYQGIFRMNDKGEFTGFFGANKTSASFLDRIKKAWMTKEQWEKEVAKRPPEVRNIALDGEGFIYTATQSDSGQVKRLNARGVNTLGSLAFEYAVKLGDVAVDEDGMIYLLDFDSGHATIYSSVGSPLFSFGDRQTPALQFGVFGQPTSIAVGQDRSLWIADAHLNVVEVFVQTEFGEKVMEAIKYDLIGDYRSSKPYWESSLAMNDYLSIAYRGLGHALNREENYEEALEYYRISYDAVGYSNAYWNIRLLWIQNNFVYLLGGLAAGIWLLVKGGRMLRSWISSRSWSSRTTRYGSELKVAWYLLFHPYNGFYQLKERKVSFVVLAVLTLSAIAAHLANVYWVGFVFKPIERGWISLPWTLIVFIVPWFTWVIANYLISTIKDGEGRFREVLQASVYAMVPYIVWMPLLTVISHFLVLEERILYDSGVNIVSIWIMALFFVMTQVIHNFEFMETLKNVVISVITIALIWMFAIVMAGLGYNLFDFFGQVLREVKVLV
ncbi:YIP1 family protein [Paenibacillus agaridevorans]|uniref:YIP1 family protein n=1 Tax=Paenibacillus agaridevorans TaxID=171404 RepID=UPI001BE44382|nr:YIP1 family protein [Paenibacillus agaridevorans]